jgi:hypothetical protein
MPFLFILKVMNVGRLYEGQFIPAYVHAAAN